MTCLLHGGLAEKKKSAVQLTGTLFDKLFPPEKSRQPNFSTSLFPLLLVFVEKIPAQHSLVRHPGPAQVNQSRQIRIYHLVTMLWVALIAKISPSSTCVDTAY